LSALFGTRDPDAGDRIYVGRTRVNVGRLDIRDVRMAVEAGGDVRGRAVLAPVVAAYLQTLRAGPDVQGVSLRVAFESVERTPDDPRFRSEASRDEAYSFSAFGVARGRYRLVAASPLPPNAYVADIRQDARSVFNDGVLQVGTNPADIELVIRVNAGVLQGAVIMDETARPPGTVAVVLVPDAPRSENLLLYKRQEITASAADPTQFRFSFTGVAPGNYRVLAWEYLPRGSEMDPAVLKSFETRGTAVRAGEGETMEVQVRLIRSDR
jgi:hypothetical protein